MPLDELRSPDSRISQEDGRILCHLASALGVSEGTIRKRVRRLGRKSVVQIIGVYGSLKVGLDTVAYVWFEIERMTWKKQLSA